MKISFGEDGGGWGRRRVDANGRSKPSPFTENGLVRELFSAAMRTPIEMWLMLYKLHLMNGDCGGGEEWGAGGGHRREKYSLISAFDSRHAASRAASARAKSTRFKNKEQRNRRFLREASLITPAACGLSTRDSKLSIIEAKLDPRLSRARSY